MPSRVFGSGIKRRIKPPARGPMVPKNFNQKFAEFAAKKGMPQSGLKSKSHFGKIKRP
jgi:hypothetical protein